jgi:transcription antitermination factor NusG
MIKDNLKKKWYAIYVKPRAEKKVAEGLDEIGIEHFLPLRRTLRTWSDRKKWVDLPLIPGYCFVYITEKESLNVLKVNHVLTYVRYLGKPAVIPDNQIEFLKRMLEVTDVRYEITDQMPEAGQAVEIIAGPFIGLQAEFMKVKRKSMVFIRIEQISNVIIVEIPVANLRILPAGEKP